MESTQAGQRLFPSEIDRQAKQTPNKVFASIPRSSDLSRGFQDVTMKDFARSINRLSAYLEPLIGYSKTFNTVAYFGPPDLRYLIMVIAVNKLGHKALFSAPRNSLPMHLHLLNAMDCHTILHAQQTDVSSMVGTHGAARHAIPELEDLLWAKDEPPHYPFTKTFEEAKNDPFLVLHTSGSTGMPKPIIESHGYTTIIDTHFHIPSVNGVPMKTSLIATPARSACVFPPWHVGGSIILGLCAGVWGNSTIVWGPTDRMAGGKEVVEMVKYGNCTRIFAGPNLYDNIVNNPEWLELMERVDHAWYGGGPLDAAVGKVLSTKTTVIGAYGSTEAGLIGLQLVTDREDWQYNYFHPTPGIQFREQTKGQYELVFVRDKQDEHLHSIWTTFPEIQLGEEWHIKDLWSKHPTKPNLWLYEGRIDDLIVFGNGSKHNPLAFEEQLRSNPLIKTALVFGTGHQQTATLIELIEPIADTEYEMEKIKNEVWPTVEAANEVAPKHALVKKSHIIFAKPSKPFSRASKGTVQRASTLSVYKEEIDELYAKFGDIKLDGWLAKNIGYDDNNVPEKQQVNAGVHGKINHFNKEAEVLELELKKLLLQKQVLELQIKEVALQLELKKLEGPRSVVVH